MAFFDELNDLLCTGGYGTLVNFAMPFVKTNNAQFISMLKYGLKELARYEGAALPEPLHIELVYNLLFSLLKASPTTAVIHVDALWALMNIGWNVEGNRRFIHRRGAFQVHSIIS